MGLVAMPFVSPEVVGENVVWHKLVRFGSVVQLLKARNDLFGDPT